MNPENVFCPNLDCPARGQVVKAFGFDERTVKNWWQRAPFARPPATHPTRWGASIAFIERLNATLRQRLPWPTRRTRTLAQSPKPSMAAGLTDHRWSYEELFSFKMPPSRWTPPKKRDRPPKGALMLIENGVHTPRFNAVLP